MTQPARPNTALRVSDLAASLKYYVDAIGCELARHDAAGDLAWISWRGYAVLLAGPGCADLTAHVASPHAAVAPGATVFFDGGMSDDLDALREALAARGVVTELVERAWGDRTLIARDPDGYTIAWWTTTPRGPDEALALYAAGPDALAAALSGLDERDLDRARAPHAWTARQIVLHIVDSEAIALGRLTFALAEPGRGYHGNPYHQDTWAAGLDYAGRDIAPAVALFRAIRVHITQLMRHLPGAWERATIAPDGTRHTAGATIAMLASHALEHIEEIRETRTPPPVPLP